MLQHKYAHDKKLKAYLYLYCKQYSFMYIQKGI